MISQRIRASVPGAISEVSAEGSTFQHPSSVAPRPGSQQLSNLFETASDLERGNFLVAPVLEASDAHSGHATAPARNASCGVISFSSDPNPATAKLAYAWRLVWHRCLA